MSLIFAACTAMGLVKKNELRKRVDELDVFINFIEIARCEILYEKKTLYEIFEKTSCLSPFFESFCKSDIFPVYNRYKSLFDVCPERNRLNKEDIRIIDSMFVVLGKTDGDDQLRVLDETVSELKDKRKKAYSDYFKLGSSYVKLGLAAGIFAVIICI